MYAGYEHDEYVQLVGQYLPMGMPTAQQTAEMQQAILRLNSAGLRLYDLIMEMESQVSPSNLAHPSAKITSPASSEASRSIAVLSLNRQYSGTNLKIALI